LGRPGSFLRLNNGWQLELLYTIRVEPSQSAGGARKLKTLNSSVQLLSGEDRQSFVFRYDYLRYAQHNHPPGHLQIRASLEDGEFLPDGRPLERIHFPTGRVTIEAIIRLLIVQFGLKANVPALWEDVLYKTEEGFLKIARHMPSGPSGSNR